MKITKTQLREIIREEIKNLNREGYERITKNMGYVKDQTAPSEYNADGSDILAAQENYFLKKENRKRTKKSTK
mgnify:CR=1 FL=1